MPLVDRYFIVHKPYNMVSQFVSPDNVPLLGDLNYDFPEGTHAVGRLDKYSEGLLLLTTDKTITRLLFQSKVPHKRIYLVQVNGVVEEKAITQLREGITFKIKGNEMYTSMPAEVSMGTPYPDNKIGNPKIYHTSSWLSIQLTEGKYHQVRKMVKMAGHKCLRLIRTDIEDIHLDILPGQVKELNKALFFKLLKI